MEEICLLSLSAFIRIWETDFHLLDGERTLLASSNANCKYGHHHSGGVREGKEEETRGRCRILSRKQAGLNLDDEKSIFVLPPAHYWMAVNERAGLEAQFTL